MIIFTSRGNFEEEIFGDLDDVITLSERSAPPTPSTNKGSIFLDTADGKLKIKKDDGSVVDLEGGGSGDLSEWSLFSAISDVDLSGFAALNVGFLRTVLSNPATAGLIRAANDEIIIAARNFLDTVSHGVKLNTDDEWETDAHWTPNQDNMLDLGNFLRAWREINVFDLNIFGEVLGDLIPTVDDVFVLGTFSPLQAWASAAIKQIVIPPGGPVNANNFSLSASTSLGIINVPINDAVEFQEAGIPGSIGDIDATGLFFPFLNLDVETIVNRKSIFLLNFENDPILNGEIARNGVDIKVMSGGLVRNLSHIGNAGGEGGSASIFTHKFIEKELWLALTVSAETVAEVVVDATDVVTGEVEIIIDDLIADTILAGQKDFRVLSALLNIGVNTVDLAWDASTLGGAGTAQCTPVQELQKDIFYRPNGLTQFVLEADAPSPVDVVLRRRPQSTAWGMSCTSDQAFGITSAQRLFFSSDGTILLVATSGGVIKKYILSSAWDISDPTFVEDYSIEADWGFYFSPSGTKLYTHSRDGVLRRRDVSPWSGSGSVVDTFNIHVDTSDIWLKSDGKKLYTGHQPGINDYVITEYKLSIPWKISTAVLNATKNIFTGGANDFRGFFIAPDGKRLFASNSDDGAIHRFTMDSIPYVGTAYALVAAET